MAYQHILVPIDGSETSFLAVQQAAEFAKAFGSKVTVVEVLLLDPYIADFLPNTRVLVQSENCSCQCGYIRLQYTDQAAVLRLR